MNMDENPFLFDFSDYNYFIIEPDIIANSPEEIKINSDHKEKITDTVDYIVNNNRKSGETEGELKIHISDFSEDNNRPNLIDFQDNSEDSILKYKNSIFFILIFRL
jgi:hypothetical protein